MPDAEVLCEHAGFLRAVARALLLDDDQADDVAQQTVLAALGRPDPGRGWMARVARNLSLMRRRSEGRRARRERAAARPEGVPATVDVVARLEVQRRVADAVLALEEPYRTAVVLRHFDGLAPAEIARRLGVPRGTVKTRLRRAHATLRARLDRETPGGRRAWSAALLPLALLRPAAALPFLGAKAALVAGVVLAGSVAYVAHLAASDREAAPKAAAAAAPEAAVARADEAPGAAEPPAWPPRMTVAVRVRDAAGEPVPGARVEATAEPGAGMPRTRDVVASAVTDAAGLASVEVDLALYLLFFAEAPGHARGAAALPPLPVTTVGGAPAVFVEPVIPEVEIVLGEPGFLEGTVFDPAGEPVAGATVFVHEEESHPVRTEASGAYRLAVAAGTYRVFAVAPELGPGFFGGALGWAEPVAVPVRAGASVPGIDVRLTPPAFAKGRLVDARGRPVPGASALVWTGAFDGRRTTGLTLGDGSFVVGPLPVTAPADSFVWLTHARFGACGDVDLAVESGRTLDLGEIRAVERAIVRGRVLGDSKQAAVHARAADGSETPAPAVTDGEFEIAVPPGRVEVFATAAVPWLVSPASVLTLRPGQVVEGVELRLGPVHSVSGQIRDPRGRPLGRVAVACSAVGSEPEGSTWTDDEGRFEFGFLAEGEYRVGLTDLAAEGTVLRDDPAPRTVRAGARDVDFVLEAPGALVRGRVVAKRDGRPVPDFQVAWRQFELFLPAGSGWGQRAGGVGEFLCRLEEPGTYAIDVEAPGFAPLRSARFTVEEDEVDLGDLALGDAGAVAGTVRDAAGRAVPYARVHLLSAKFEAAPGVHFTDADGRFEVRGLAPGVYNLFVVSPRHPLGVVRGVLVKEGETADVRHSLDPAAPLTLVVRDGNGLPVEGARLVYTFAALLPLDSDLARQHEPETFGANASDARGEIRKPLMPAGEVVLRVEAEGFRPWRETLVLPPGEPRTVDVRLEPAPE